ncbi:MAG: DAK2 domain-containing protein [Bacilli bacterium]|jgi:DAK2 domain fusion protein YloV|nr:DAK2 domain-containing protein [Bacilli bacterium]
MKTINGQRLKQMFLSGANNLYNHYPEIDQLNVFPVPDGDTGMNMNLTLTSGCKEINNLNDSGCAAIAKAFSGGLLMGARGNSGVITSQIFRGFSDAAAGKTSLNAKSLAACWSKGKEVAYKAVMTPVEGTILTVIREAAAGLEGSLKKETSVEESFDILLREAKLSLERTPDLLPILKEVGVVDSGGAGLCVVLEGMTSCAHGKFVNRASLSNEATPVTNVLSAYAGAKLSEDEEGYGYCTQFILRLGKAEDFKKPFIEKRFQNFLTTHGKSLVLARDEDIVKVHVHTLNPGIVLNYAQNYGEFVTVTIENMSEEHKNIQNGDLATDMNANIARQKAKKVGVKPVKKPDDPLADYALIAVSSGAGLDEMFRELGVSKIVGGGQTMNPATKDFVKAIDEVHAKNVFILPNNSNIVLAASQACEVVAAKTKDIVARVVPSKTIPQGIVSCMQFNPEETPSANYAAMKSALRTVKSGSITYAIKDTDIANVHITKGYYMGMKDDKTIVSCKKDKFAALYELIDSLVGKKSTMVSVMYGGDVKEEEANAVSEKFTASHPDVDLDIRNGGQPVYSFLVGVE